MDLDRLQSLDGVDVAGKRVLVRADLNVPMAGGAVSDATRIERFLPTVKDLAGRGARVVVMSHFGRPKGERRPEMSLAPVAEKMRAMLGGGKVGFAENCVGEAAERGVAALGPGEVLLLENLRYHPGEEANDEDFARALGALGDLYVNDAFSCAHRAHASTAAIARHLPAYAGRAMMAEIAALRSALEQPERPVAAIVGGAKISTKIPVLGHLVGKVDQLIIGGAMANTFLHARGIDVAGSLCEPDYAGTALEVTAEAAAAGCEIVLPVDAVVAEKFEEGAASAVCDVEAVPAGQMILDIGPRSVADLERRIAVCRTLLWNGPLGAFEVAPFGEGTFAVARAAARLTGEGRLATVAGGGDTVAALNAAGVMESFSYVSTAGGAFLEWLEGRELPGVAALIAA